MKKIGFLLVILFSMVTNFGCGKKDLTDMQPEETTGEVFMSDIVFLYQCMNYSDTYVNYGCFIDNTGKLFTYDVSKEDQKYGDKESLIDYLKNTKFEKEELKVDLGDLKSNYEKMMQISENTEIEETPMGADVMECTLYGIKGDETVFLFETGNTERIVNDENAKAVVEWFNKIIENISLYPASLTSE